MTNKWFVFWLCLLPLFALVVQVVAGFLGPDVGKALVLTTGEWGLRFLLLTLAISPVRRWTRFKGLVRYRRMLGLYSWFYASLHLLAVLTYLLGWSWAIFVEEFVERPYMALGIIAWLLLLPLGLTSNRWSQRKLGKRWKTLHKLVYPVALLACSHLVWQVRSDISEALIYSLMLLILLLSRLVAKVKQSDATARA